MDTRTNTGYTITDSITIGEMEFVLGKLDGNIPMFVTWACNGGDYYYWGHYFSDLHDAKKDLLSRASMELDYTMRRQGRSDNKEPREKEAGKEYER